MEHNFVDTCRQIARYFDNLADAYDEDKQIIKVRLDEHDKEIVKNNETKKRMVEVLREDLNGWC